MAEIHAVFHVDVTAMTPTRLILRGGATVDLNAVEDDALMALGRALGESMVKQAELQRAQCAAHPLRKVGG